MYMEDRQAESSQLKTLMLKRQNEVDRCGFCEALSLLLVVFAMLFANCVTEGNQLNLALTFQCASGINVNSCSLSKIPRDAKLNLPFPIKIATAADKAGPYTTFFIIRHAPTKNNHIIHGSKFDSEILTTSSNDKNNILKLKNCVNFSKVYTAESMRASSTASLICKDGYTKTWLFNEQKLGCLEGMEKNVAMKTTIFWKMFDSWDYLAPPGKNGEAAETGLEVTKRAFFGLFKIAAENVGKTVAICTSQGIMNWIYKRLSNNPSAFIKVKNYGVIIFKYYNESHAIELLTSNGSVSLEEAMRIYEASCQIKSN